MSVFTLFQLFEAQSFKELPALLREIVGDDEERRDDVTERFLELNDKDRWAFLQDIMKTCLKKGLDQERAFYHVFFQQGVRGFDIDETWEEMIQEDCDEHFTVAYGTQTDPVSFGEASQSVSIPMTTDNTPKPKKTHRTRYTASYCTYHCAVCGLNLASDGSLHNHYESTRHLKSLKQRLEAIRRLIKIDDKVFVDFRTGANAPELTWHCETQEDIEDTLRGVEKYLNDEKKCKINPIRRLTLCRHPTITGADGVKRLSVKWNPLTNYDSPANPF